MTNFDRRRILLASLLTVTALLAGAWWNSRSGAQSSTTKAAPSTTKYVPQLPIFLDDVGTVAPLSGKVAIVVGTLPKGLRAVTQATYRHLGSGSCMSNLAPAGTKVRVTAIDNGQAKTCTVLSGPITDKNIGIVLDTRDFAAIADLADSPIHVRLTW